VTADSGVVMEASGREDPSLPGAVPGDIPPSLTGGSGEIPGGGREEMKQEMDK